MPKWNEKQTKRDGAIQSLWCEFRELCGGYQNIRRAEFLAIFDRVPASKLLKLCGVARRANRRIEEELNHD